VTQLLQSIKNLVGDTEDGAPSYPGQTSVKPSGNTALRKGRVHFEKFQGTTSRRSRAGWALRGKARFLALVVSFDALVQKLHDLVPPDQYKIMEQVVAGGRNANLTSSQSKWSSIPKTI
jgi:hypothetical protein